ncbi:GDP-L-fucose synthase [Helicobacter sp. MIT 14-3879]|uniref:GDP-L-fucose synthase family protein n=1 Tax=Helicobacter sp. MIT 14-3879 TaxID=2040649 RepID=UPI000E1E91F3|nr:GDP-L-fucose synthase [Helicobacter sp. MIT 14-3879]RDU65479.1 GDP-L-fucose synthase [Helicobacter sp. MIT 14-3879]
MNLDSKIFVAGHRGLVGSSIVEILNIKGYNNIIFKTHSELDLKDNFKVEDFFRKENIEYVFLCAAKVGGILANNTYRADFIYENLSIQNNVIYNSYKYGVKKLLFLGSSCIYPKNAKQPIKEESLLSGELEYTNEPYAIAKIAGLKMVESFSIQYNCNFLSVMPTNLYGNNDNFNLETSHVLPALMRKIHLAKLLENNDIKTIQKDTKLENSNLKEYLEKFGISKDRVEIWGSGKPRREFLHSIDMAKACVHIMENINFRDLTSNLKEMKNTHINIGYGSDISIYDLANLIKNIIGFNGELFFNTDKPDGTFQKLLDTTRLNSLGFKPTIDLESGIKSVYEHYKTK